MINRIKGHFFKSDCLSSLKKEPVDSESRKACERSVAKTLRIFGDNYKTLDPELHDALVRMEFRLKTFDPGYQLISKVALRILNLGKEVTEGEKSEELVLSHPDEYLFLASPKHFLAKHLQVMQRDWKMEGIKIRESEGRLLFHDGSDIRETMEEARQNKKLILNLDLSGVRREHQELKPSFERKGDGCFYFSAVTLCPKEEITFRRQHTWIRLQDDQGKVYSFGKLAKKVEHHRIFGTTDSLFMSSDRYEWVAPQDKLEEMQFRVSKEKFSEILADLQKDVEKSVQVEQGRAYFHFMGANCTDYVMEKLRSYGIVSPDEGKELSATRIHRYQFFLPHSYPLSLKWKKRFERAPGWLQKPLRLLFGLIDLPARLTIALMGLKGESPLKKNLSIAHPYPFRLWLRSFASKHPERAQLSGSLKLS